jgi:hypothetical protein
MAHEEGLVHVPAHDVLDADAPRVREHASFLKRLQARGVDDAVEVHDHEVVCEVAEGAALGRAHDRAPGEIVPGPEPERAVAEIAADLGAEEPEHLAVREVRDEHAADQDDGQHAPGHRRHDIDHAVEHGREHDEADHRDGKEVAVEVPGREDEEGIGRDHQHDVEGRGAQDSRGGLERGPEPTSPARDENDGEGGRDEQEETAARPDLPQRAHEHRTIEGLEGRLPVHEIEGQEADGAAAHRKQGTGVAIRVEEPGQVHRESRRRREGAAPDRSGPGGSPVSRRAGQPVEADGQGQEGRVDAGEHREAQKRAEQ